jgi:hypothetical protein
VSSKTSPVIATGNGQIIMSHTQPVKAAIIPTEMAMAHINLLTTMSITFAISWPFDKSSSLSCALRLDRFAPCALCPCRVAALRR